MGKLGIYLETNYFINSSNNKLFCEDLYVNLFNHFDPKEFEIHIIGKVTPIKSINGYEFTQPVKFYEVSYYNSLVSLLLTIPIYIPKNIGVIKKFVDTCDKFLIMTPSPIANIILFLAQKENKKCSVLVRQNSYDAITNRYTGIKKIFARWLTQLLEGWVERYCKNYQPVVFALGGEIFTRYSKFSKNTIQFVSSRYKNLDVIPVESVKQIKWDEEINILYVGRLEVNKGLRELVEAINELKKYKIKLTIVGVGKIRRELDEMIIMNKLEDRIILKGYIPFGSQLFCEYHNNQILILPSYSEGLPQVILEGMASGCLILATNVGGIPYIIEHEKSGYLFAPFSSNEIKHTIIYLIENNIDSKPICTQSLNIAMKYTFENQIGILIDNLN